MDRRHFLQAIGGVLAAIGAGQFLPHVWARAAHVDAAPVKVYTAEELVTGLTAFAETSPIEPTMREQIADWFNTASLPYFGHQHVSTAWQDRAVLTAGTWQSNRIAKWDGDKSWAWKTVGESHNEPIELPDDVIVVYRISDGKQIILT